VLSSHPATRMAYRRYMVDQLRWLTDPGAERAFKQKKARASHWWDPGETAPQRGPDFRTLLGQ
jgi:hypothetical protein